MLKIIVICLFLVNVFAVKGVDISQPLLATTFECMKNNGITFVIVRGFRSEGTYDTEAGFSLENANKAGLTTDIYMSPCRGKTAKHQVNQLFSNVSPTLYNRVWIDVQTNMNIGCDWPTQSFQENCDYVKQIAKAITSHNKTAGIYVTQFMWNKIMGSQHGCPELASHYHLWYAHYDKTPSFSDFSGFGGWNKPYMKQYNGDQGLCHASVNYNYHN